MGVIYTLSDPATDTVKYIGKTSIDLKDRFRRHLNDKARNLRTNWIKSLKKKGLIPKMDVLEVCEGEDHLSEMEIYWIYQFRTWGFKLKNMTNGGDGGVLAKETKLKISKSRSRLTEEENDELIRKYHLRKYTQKELGSFFGITRKAVEFRLKKAGITPERLNKPLNEAQKKSLLKGRGSDMWTPERKEYARIHMRKGLTFKGVVMTEDQKMKISKGNRKLSDIDVYLIKSLYDSGLSQQKISDMYGVSQVSISQNIRDTRLQNNFSKI